jgi:hypothetical protein
MPERFADDLRVNPCLQALRCVPVPEIVQPHPREPGREGESVEPPGQHLGVNRTPVTRSTTRSVAFQSAPSRIRRSLCSLCQRRSSATVPGGMETVRRPLSVLGGPNVLFASAMAHLFVMDSVQFGR